ncbi:MAG TPA: radical SAM protein [Vicinamibacteria bacterium]|nr:radical SAM protein [Vicinamibacteria bacterium]
MLRKLRNRAIRVRRGWQTRKFVEQGDGIADPLPHFVVYEPTLLCNLHCSFCYVADILNPEDWRSKELTLPELDRIFAGGAVKAFNITGGEPFVRKNLIDIFELLRQKGMRCDYVTTNGTILGEGKASALLDLARSGFLRHVSVSLDGPPALHDEMRGQRGAFEKAARNIRTLRESFARKGVRLPLSINTTLTAKNLHLLEEVVDEAEKLEVDLIGLNQLMFATPREVRETLELIGETDPAVISTHVTADPGIDPKEVPRVLRRAVAYAASKGITINWRPAQGFDDLEKYYTPDRALAGRCFYPFFGGRITYDGKVHFCPFIRVEVGDLRAQSLSEVWNSKRYVELRRKLLEEGIFPVCRRCCKVELDFSDKTGTGVSEVVETWA